MVQTEEQINESICTYLSHRSNAIARIAPSGFYSRNYKTGKMYMRKHKSKFIRRGVSDILYWENGHAFAFEVKTPIEYKFIVKHYDAIKKSNPKSLSKKKFHIWEQLMFLEDLRTQGVTALFVCSVNMVAITIAKQIPVKSI